MPDDASAARRWALLRTMLRMRRFEEAVFRLSSERRFAGHFHIYIGQEATGAAIIAALDARDRLADARIATTATSLRAAPIPRRRLAEILGRAGGLNGGRSGTLHLCDPSLGFISTSAVVGGCISLAVGAGYACKQAGDGAVAAAFFGDGALEEGVSYEAMNIASLLRLPVLFVCENNSVDAWGAARGGFPTSGSCRRHRSFCSCRNRSASSRVRVDGADTDEIGAAATAAIAKCRDGHGPVFIECVTRRWAGSNPLWPVLVDRRNRHPHGDRRGRDRRRACRLVPPSRSGAAAGPHACGTRHRCGRPHPFLRRRNSRGHKARDRSRRLRVRSPNPKRRSANVFAGHAS